MLHDIKELDVDPAAEGHQAVISGHSHKSSVQEQDGVLYLNPGSAGPRRLRLPVCVAELTIKDGEASGEIIELSV